jgi:hypothetical protein
MSDYRPPRLGAALFISVLFHASLVYILSLESASRFLSSIAQQAPAALEVRMTRVHKPSTDSMASRPVMPKPAATVGLQMPSEEDVEGRSDNAPALVPAPVEAPVRMETTVGTVAERDVVINLETGNRLPEKEQAEATFDMPPIGFTIQVSPAGKMEKWSSDGELPSDIVVHLQLLNNLIRNMQYERTGETHSVAWLAYLVEKDGVWIAKLQQRYGNANLINKVAP